MPSQPRKRLVAVITRGQSALRHRQATRLVVDDFGDAVAYEFRCSSCMRWHSWKRGWCMDCSRLTSFRWRDQDRERARRFAREARLARFLLFPDAREQEREAKRRLAREARERDLAAVRERSRLAARRTRERVRKDPERHARGVEMARVDNVLRRIDAGKRQGPRRVNGTSNEWERKYVPSAPLAIALATCGRRAKDVAADAGQSERLYLTWRTGERRCATWGSADSLLVALDLMWWQVYDPEDAAPRTPLCHWTLTDRARTAMPHALAPRRCAGSSGAFSGVRSRDVVAWLAAAEAAVELWEPDEAEQAHGAPQMALAAGG